MLHFPSCARQGSSSDWCACVKASPLSEPISTGIDLPVLWYSKRKKGSVWNVCQWVFLPPLASKRTGERAWSLSAVVGRVWGRAARRKGWIERRTPLKRLRLSRPNPSLRSAAFFHAKRNIRSFCRQFSGSKHGYLGFHGTNSFPGRRAQLQKFRIVRFLSYFN